MEEKAIAHTDQGWQNHHLQVGRLCTDRRTLSYCRHKSPKRCRCSIRRPSADSFGSKILQTTASNPIWGYNNSGPQSSPIRGTGTRLGNSMDTALFVQKQGCTRYDEKFASILIQKASLELFYTDNFSEFTQACEDVSCNHDQSTPTSIRNKWHESPTERSEE